MMATMKITIISPPPTTTGFQLKHHPNPTTVCLPTWHTLSTTNGRKLDLCNSRGNIGSLVKPLLAAQSGVEASISDENVVTVRNANVVVESQDDDKMQVKVELPGKETQIVFDKVLTNLARTAPPVPGFRRQKGGKTSKVPKSFLLSIIGEDRVTKFVIQEIVSSTMAEYVKKNNLPVKDNKINTIQTADELQSSFIPGDDFGFNATLELEKTDTETATSEA